MTNNYGDAANLLAEPYSRAFQPTHINYSGDSSSATFRSEPERWISDPETAEPKKKHLSWLKYGSFCYNERSSFNLSNTA
ncbi:unnamed protein product [Schistosoma curassoni]|uniref:Ovule protein n=1 Tax=Schistosoma curassoni TaxID=6186 RepID=A0A183JQS8_9TREM|nr:unnamed protein product [Schistosoma curassoni]